MGEMKSHYEHIVGGSDASRKEALIQFQKAFEIGAKQLRREKPKTENEHDLIRDTEAKVDQMVEAWGGTIKDIPTSHIHLVEPGHTERATGGRLRGGVHNPITHSVAIGKFGSTFIDSHNLAHELFHLKSFKSGQIRKDSEIAPYRSGLQMIDRHDQTSELGFQKIYFGNLEEAIVAESAMIFSLETQDDIEVKQELDATRTIIELACNYFLEAGASAELLGKMQEAIICIPGAAEKLQSILDTCSNTESQQAYAAGLLKALEEQDLLMVWERPEERAAMYKLIDRIIIASDGQYSTRREVFDILARANYSGNYIPLARVIEGLFGEGSFRKLAEEFAEKRTEPKINWMTLLKQFIKEE